MADTENTSRSQMYKHEDIAEWLTEQGHINPKSTQAEVIAAAFAHRNEYRATERYAALKEAGDPQKAARDAARAEAKAAKDAERAAAKAAKEAAAAAKAEKAEKAPAKATKASKAAPAKATKATKKAAASTDENPFD